MKVQVLCAAAVKISVESDVESFVSRYEKHFKADRQLGKDTAKFEMEIAENGPLLRDGFKKKKVNGIFH